MSQHDRLDHRPIRSMPNGSKQALQVPGSRNLLARYGDAQPRKESTQIFGPRCRWRVMDPVEPGQLVLRKEAGSTDIRSDHAFLDEPVGIVALHGTDVGNPPCIIEHDLALLAGKVDGTSALTRIYQCSVKFVECVEAGGHARQFRIITANRVGAVL